MFYRKEPRRHTTATSCSKRKRDGGRSCPAAQPDPLRVEFNKPHTQLHSLGDGTSGAPLAKRPSFYYKEEKEAWKRGLASDKKARQLSRAKSRRTKENALWAYDEDIFEPYSPPQLSPAAAAAGLPGSKASGLKAASTGPKAKPTPLADCIPASPCSEGNITPILAKHAGINEQIHNANGSSSSMVGESASDKLRHLEHDNPWSVLADMDNPLAGPIRDDAHDSASHEHASTAGPHQPSYPPPSELGGNSQNHAAPARAPPDSAVAHEPPSLPHDKAGQEDEGVEHAVAPLAGAISVSPRPVPTPPLCAPQPPLYGPDCNAPDTRAPHAPPPKAQTCEEQSSGRAPAPRRAWLNRLGAFCSQPCVLWGVAAGTGLIMAGMMARRR